MMITLSPSQTPFLLFSELLEDIPGREYEQHRHPAVILDRAMGPGTQVWGWWTRGRPARPCLLWCGERGWGAAVVDPQLLGLGPYEHASWPHRIRMLDRALATALGPYPTLDELERHIPSAGLDHGRDDCDISAAVSWGVRTLRAARMTNRRVGRRLPREFPLGAEIHGELDEELARHALIPTLAKAAPDATSASSTRHSVHAVADGSRPSSDPRPSRRRPGA
jgi:hypothetical protein